MFNPASSSAPPAPSRTPTARAAEPMPRPRGDGAECVGGRCEQRRRGDEFERVLRRKSGGRDGEDDAPTSLAAAEMPALPSGAPWALPTPPAAAAERAVTPPTPAAGAEPPAPSATAAAAAQRTASSTPPGPTLHSDAGSSWELSLRDPRGVAVDLRATRADPLLPGATPAPWTLTLATPGLAHAALQQHAPRLHERLRTRALGELHLRIEPQGRRHPRDGHDEGDTA